ncbi:MAG: DUF1080 domain-containing protein [Armatimonadetes bacterium]|nr:DUF1080 domain-containing protein [Armatimonadota bacterium]
MPDRKTTAPGFDDTPFLPGSRFRVHDKERPQPPIIVPATGSTREAPGRPPSDAVVLFNGKDTSAWVGRDGGPAPWKVGNGLLVIAPKTGNIQTKAQFGNCQVHVEWNIPAGTDGNRNWGNSGVFLMGRYEVQILNVSDALSYADGLTAAIYGQYPPLVNACLEPGAWQTFDILWEVPLFEGEKLVRPAYMTVIYNGVAVHHHAEWLGGTAYRQVPVYRPHPPTGPLMLQDHGNPVLFRNIWCRPMKGYDEP